LTLACAGLLEPGGCLQAFRHNSLLKCALQPKIAKKITTNLYFRGSRSFKIIDVDKSKSTVQHVCTYPQPISH